MSSRTSSAIRTNMSLSSGALHSGLNRVRKDVGDTSKVLNNLGDQAMKVGGILGAAFAVTNLSQMADAYSDMHSRIGVAIGSMDEASDVMSRLTDTALGTYSSLETTVEGFLATRATLKDLGLTTQQQLDYTEALNNAMVVSGAKGEDAARVQKALADAMVLGGLKGDQLNTILMRGGRVAELLAAELGTTVSGLRQAGSEGKITGDVIKKVLIGNLELLREEAASMPGTIADGFTQMRTGLTALVGSVNTATGTTEKLSAAMTALGQAMVAVSKMDFSWLVTLAQGAAVAAVGLLTAKIAGVGLAAVQTARAVGVAFAVQYQATVALTTATTALGRAMTMLGGPVGVIVTGMMMVGLAVYKATQRHKELLELVGEMPGRVRDADAAWREYARNRTIEAAEEAMRKNQEALEAKEAEIELKKRELQREATMPAIYVPGTESVYEAQDAAVAKLRTELEALETQAGEYRDRLTEAKAEIEGNAGATELLNQKQSDILQKLNAQNTATREKNGMDAVAAQYGAQSLQYAVAEATAKRDAAIAAAQKAVADADGNAQVAEAANEAIRLANETYNAQLAAEGLVGPLADASIAVWDAESATWRFEGAMWKVHGAVSAVMGVLQALGAGIDNVTKARTLDLIRNKVDPLKARVQAEREMQLQQHDAAMQAALRGGNVADYAKLAIERGQIVTGNSLDDQIAAETEAYRESNRGGKGGGGGGKGGKGGGKSKLSDEAKQAKKDAKEAADAYEDLQNRVTDLGATLGMTALEQRIYNEQKKVGTAASKEAVEALVREEDRLKRLQDAIDQSRDAFRAAFTDIVTGTRSAREVVGDVLGDIAKQFADFAANQVFQYLIGAIGSSFSFGGVKGFDPLSNALRGTGAFGVPGFANGVTNFGGGLAMVGELGRELVQLPKGSNVIPSSKTENILGEARKASKLEVSLSPDLIARERQANRDASIQITRDGISQNNKGFNKRAANWQSDPTKRR